MNPSTLEILSVPYCVLRDIISLSTRVHITVPGERCCTGTVTAVQVHEDRHVLELELELELAELPQPIGVIHELELQDIAPSLVGGDTNNNLIIKVRSSGTKYVFALPQRTEHSDGAELVFAA